MTLPEFLLRRNERRSTWLFVRSWIPARGDRYSWLRVAAFTVGSSVLAAGLVGLGFGLLTVVITVMIEATNPPPTHFLLGFFLPFAAEFGACAGLCWSLISRLCWNQRATQLAARPGDPILTAPVPKLGFFRRFGLGGLYALLVGLVTPMLLFHAIENTRGAWAWRQMRAELKAKGECFELPCVIPPPARDEENFFATPFWQKFAYRQERTADGNITNIWLHPPPFAYTTNFVLPEEPETVKRNRGIAEEPTDGRNNLVAWAAHLRFVTTNTGKIRYGGPRLTFPLPATPGDPAKDVLFALSKFDATLAEFAAAAPRPRNRYPTHYEDGFRALLPNLAAMKAGTRICQLRAVARLAAGDSAGAAVDTLLAFRLGESLREEPILISQLVRLSCDNIAMRALWQGLADHRWDDAQLAAFQKLLSQRDYAGGLVHSLEGERALGNDAAEKLLLRRGTGLAELDKLGGDSSENTGPGMMAALAYVMPSGWYRQNQVRLLHGYQLILDHVRVSVNRTNRATALDQNLRSVDLTDDYVQKMRSNPSPYNILVGMLLPAIARTPARSDRAEATAQLAVVACALERHRLAHGTFPVAVAELVPAYLPAVPADWMGGQPLHYERTDDGWFRLWSVGPNGKDDGGVFRKLNDNGRRVSDDLDWPWPLPLPSRDARLF